MVVAQGAVRVGWIAVLCAAFGAAGLTAGSSAAEERVRAGCGGPGQAACPLQGWMRSSIATPLASSDTAALASALERTARFSPDASWSSWGSFARDGADAARRGEITATRAACKGCHDAWREAYRARYRARPLPR